jgi:DNA-directed RNA polymerase specialized sigma24 family protein
MLENKYDHLNEYARTLIRVKASQLARRPEFSKSDAEDIEQDLAIQIYFKIAQYDSNRSSLNTFLARVVDSSVAMMIRDRGRLKRGGGVRKRHSIGHDTPIPGTSCEQGHLSTSLDVASVLDQLPTELRQICCELMTEKRSKVWKQRKTSPRQFASSLKLIREHFHKNGINCDYQCAK